MASVQAQTGVDIEHIIVDGCSNDGTWEKVLELCRKEDIVISEPDNGIYDALNKGLELATGDVLGILHSDDKFADQNVLLDIKRQFLQHLPDVVYGNVDLGNFDMPDHFQVVRKFRSEKFPGTLNYGWMPAHPALFFNKTALVRIGLFDQKLKISADYEWMIRLFLDNSLKKVFFDRVTTLMALGGQSTGGLASERKKFLEDYRVIKRHKLPVFTTLIFKKLRKLPQYRARRI